MERTYLLALAAIPALAASRAAAQTPPATLPPGLELQAAAELNAPRGAASRLPRPEALTTFDPNALELIRNEGRWALTAGGTVLKEFGRREEEARQAWHLIRELRLNQRGTIGTPQPVLEYWLSDGQPPRWLPRGVRVYRFNLASLQLEQSLGRWLLRETSRPLFSFGNHKEDAQQALAVLQKYGFNQLGVVGHGLPAMLVFVAQPDDSKGLTPEQHFNRRVALLKQQASTFEGQRQADALTAIQGKSPPPANFPVPAMPALRAETLPGREPIQSHPGRRPAPAEAEPLVVTERVPFDWRQAQVRRDNGSWKLMVGSYTLADFGTDERDARLAQAALMHFRCTERLLVGAPEPVVSYFLTSGQAPRGLMAGVFSEAFHPEVLASRQLGSRYYVTHAGRPLLDCGPKPEEARYMLCIIRKYGFDNICRIGLDDKHSLTFLVRSH
jgi:hypothetical protein